MERLDTYLEHIVRRAVRPVVHGVAVLHTAHMYIEAVLGGPAPVRKLRQQPLLCCVTNILRVSKTSKIAPHVVPAGQSIQHVKTNSDQSIQLANELLSVIKSVLSIEDLRCCRN